MDKEEKESAGQSGRKFNGQGEKEKQGSNEEKAP